jgi:hypothetical protein
VLRKQHDCHISQSDSASRKAGIFRPEPPRRIVAKRGISVAHSSNSLGFALNDELRRTKAQCDELTAAIAKLVNEGSVRFTEIQLTFTRIVKEVLHRTAARRTTDWKQVRQSF